MRNKKILWIRKLVCGHERSTNVNFILKDYTKPKVGDSCYCRECHKDVKIIKVKESTRTKNII